MRLFLSIATAATLIGCTPAPPLHPPQVAAPATPAFPPVQTFSLPAEPAPPAQTAPTAPATPAHSPSFREKTVAGIRFTGVAFDSRKNRLLVADQPAGPGSRWPDAAAAARALGGIAAINGGFFTPEGAPLGLAISSGKRAGNWNSASSLGSGVWHDARISRRESLGAARAKAATQLLQAGPMLVENSRAVSGLDREKTSARTLILWDGATRWWIGVSTPCTLTEAAAALAQTGPAGWKPRFALNLDGGRSSEIWISQTIPGGPFQRRPLWNRPVRNFLILKEN